MDSRAQELIEYLKKNVIVGSAARIDEDTPLVSSGLVDSFALIEVLTELEKITGRRIPSGRISPRDLETVRQMLMTAESVGRPAD